MNRRATWTWAALALLVCGIGYLYVIPRREAAPPPASPGVAAPPFMPMPPPRGGPGRGPGLPLRGGRMFQSVDLNTASLSQLETLPGMTPDYAHKIIAGRPFHDRSELVRAGIPREVFDRMSPPAYLKFDVIEVPPADPVPHPAPAVQPGAKP